MSDNNKYQRVSYLTHEMVCRSKTLTSHFTNQFDLVNRWYRFPCCNLKSIESRAIELENFSIEQRTVISDILVQQQELFKASNKAIENAKLIRKPNTQIIIAGQQAGILGGPLYTLHKAIATIKYAQKLNQYLQKYSFVPVFWIASEDHDFAEINHGSIPTSTGLATFEYRYAKDEPSRPAYEQVFTADIEHMLEKVQELVGPVNDLEALDVCRSVYKPGGNVVLAFGTWMSWLLSAYGLVVLDPSDLDFKQHSLEFMHNIIDKTPILHSILTERTLELETAGYTPQVSITPGDTQLFRVDRNGRQKLSYHQEDKKLHIADGRSFSIEEIHTQLNENPRLLSTGVLIRPVWQDYMMPVALQLGGSAEISYMAQVNVVHSLLNVPEPVLAVRPGLTLLSQSDDQFTQRYKVDLLKLVSDVTSEIDRALSGEYSIELDNALNTLHNQFHSNLNVISEEVGKLDQGLVRTTTSLAVNLDNFIENLKNKVYKVIRGKHQNTVNSFNTLASHIFPNGNLQERVLTVAPLVWRYGRELVQAIFERLPDKPCEHPIVVIGLIEP